MSTQIKRSKVLLISAVCAFGCLGMVVFIFSGCPIYPEWATSPDSLPRYLVAVWPPPGWMVSKLCYTNEIPSLFYPNIYVPSRGVGVALHAVHVEEVINPGPTDIRRADVSARTHLYIDGEKVDPDTLQIFFTSSFLEILDTEGNTHRYPGYAVTWLPQLNLGIHKARLELINDDGKEFEYSWNFFVLP